MNEIGEKFLPIGTVVMLKEGTKRVMITGFCSAAEEDPNKVWDYTGCPYPEGYISSNQTCLFDHSQINKVYYTGLKDDEEEKLFKEQLDKLFAALNNAKSSAISNTPENSVEKTSEVVEIPVPNALNSETQTVSDNNSSNENSNI